MKETGNRSTELPRHQAWKKMVKFSRSKRSLLVILAVFFLLQLPAAAGYEISFTVAPLRTHSYTIDLQRNDLLTYSFSVTGGDGSINFAIKDSGGKIVFDAGKVRYYYSNEFKAPKSDIHSLYFGNWFATTYSKHVHLGYEVKSPPPQPPPGRLIKVSTDKAVYLVGENVLITAYWPLLPVRDLCLYHLVKCEIFDSVGRPCGTQQWDDRYTRFPVTWPFRLFQPGAYTIVASFWHNGETKGGEDKTTITMISPAPTPTPPAPPSTNWLAMALVVLGACIVVAAFVLRRRPA